jgi:hypothetical protein
MNDMERKIEDYVNRAQLVINDWQCSGDKYYLLQAETPLGKAVRLTAERDADRAERDDA